MKKLEDEEMENKVITFKGNRIRNIIALWDDMIAVRLYIASKVMF